MGRSRVHRRSTVWKILMTLVVLGLSLCIGFFLVAKLLIEPNLEGVSKMRAEVIVSRTVNKALAKQFQEEQERESLFSVQKGEDGRMELVQANSIEINILMSQLSMNLQEAFQQMEKERYEVPVGSLLGSQIFSQTGPSVEIAITPMSVSSMDFRTEFETQGINQTKYKIYIELGCRIKVLAPFSSRTFCTSNTILIAEAVILGDVPDSYVEVPKEDILDVTD